MNLFVVGVSHKTSTVDVREQFFLRPRERELLLVHLRNEPSVVESFVLSTCNRTEIYARLIRDDPFLLLQFIFRAKDLSFSRKNAKYFYVKKDREAVRHLCHVACGLDSLVIGERQILGQVKDAAELARRNGAFSKTFHILSRVAIHAGKAAQTETCIGWGGSSVSWAAVTMADYLLGSLEGKNVLLVGAGKMSRLTIEQLARKSINEIFVMNRTLEKAEELARQIGGEAVLFWDIKEILRKVEVCICSAGAPHYLIEPELMRQVMPLRQGRPIFLIDISTPRNINPEVSSIAGVRLISIDDLQKVVAGNMEKRRSAIEDVKRIVDRHVDCFYQKVAATRLVAAG